VSAAGDRDRLKEIFEAAAARPIHERDDYLQTACGDDSMLRKEVERLLSAHDRAGSFLETPAVPLVSRAGGDDDEHEHRPALVAGTQLGAYEIIRLVGVGGMGEVDRARDPRIDRDVAVKVLPAVVANDRDRLRRFEQEARAAGALNHPNIVAIYDVGTDQGTACSKRELD
jgi:serine/threonine protein kinase